MNWRSKIGPLYRLLNFTAHIVFKKRRTARTYRKLALGKYLTKRQAEILIRVKAKEK